MGLRVSISGAPPMGAQTVGCHPQQSHRLCRWILYSPQKFFLVVMKDFVHIFYEGSRKSFQSANTGYSLGNRESRSPGCMVESMDTALKLTMTTCTR